MNKKESRLRRARKTRARIAEQKKLRLTVHRSNNHIYAQIVDETGSKILASASTLSAESQLKSGGNAAAAAAVGKAIAERAKGAGLLDKDIAFDRSGYKYHGRVKALADAAREGGLKF